MRLALRLMGVLKVDKKLQDRLFKEIQDSLHEELNYENRSTTCKFLKLSIKL